MAEPESITALHQQLDSLWIRYLDFLDQYTQAQRSIKNSLGKGFFSLAQANFTSPGRRYGQDHYDQRAMACSRVQIDDDEDGLRVKIATIKIEVPHKEETTTHLPTPEPEDGEEAAEPAKETTQQPTPEPEETHSHEEKAEEEPPRLPSGPLRQFGILIPPALRSAQKSFAKVVQHEDCLTKAVNSARGMREVEAEIRRARKVLKKAERNVEGGVEVE